MKKEIICISCPNGCALEVDVENGKVLSIKGSECKKGLEYAKNEILNPIRFVTTTVKITGSSLPLLPVRTSMPVPRELCSKIVKKASKIKVKAPVKIGQIIAPDILSSGADLIATRSLK
ncbi:MAG TPA: molybdopterin oxidoreductase [Lentisphaeria bacterium]|nr:MAG: molybdopterin oxidoreductase [Lentisphaerae bacterium GWF2_49_21]HBC87358.1 molybdopterin oxidoreductase [Lentisphaeria bacterium]